MVLFHLLIFNMIVNLAQLSKSEGFLFFVSKLEEAFWLFYFHFLK